MGKWSAEVSRQRNGADRAQAGLYGGNGPRASPNTVPVTPGRVGGSRRVTRKRRRTGQRERLAPAQREHNARIKAMERNEAKLADELATKEG